MPVVVVTGASHGIGQAVAEAFAGVEDARLVLMARTDEKLERVAVRCRERGGEALVLPCDVTDEKAVFEAAGRVLEEWDAPDVVVNNAGVFFPGSFGEISIADFREQVEVNLTSAFIVTKAFLGGMRDRQKGHFFFMGSVASTKGYPGGAAYAAAKHGLRGLARTLREETKEEGIRITTLLPGATYTPSWEGAGLPEERFMPPDDVASAVVDAFRLSRRSVVEEILLRPQLGDI